jgi:methionyl aminopeptidase
MIPVKTSDEIQIMREACRIAANVLDKLCRMVSEGMNTYDLDQEGRILLQKYGARSACFGYQVGDLTYPAHTCLSVNDEIVHGIGTLRRVLCNGDIITVDVCVDYQGYIGDNARTIAVGDVPESVQFLLDSTRTALEKGIEKALPGNRVGEISHAVEKFIRPRKLGIVRDFVGHGVGRSMHEAPQIPNFGSRKQGDRLRPGNTLAIEPMITLGSPKVRMARDGWTALTADGKPSAHFEHTVLITDGKPEILTIPDSIT